MKHPGPVTVCPPGPKSVSEGLERLVFVGDVHGSSDGLVEVLAGAGVIADGDVRCSRLATELSERTLLVQMGDIVDRGPNATAAWDCLDNLQRTSAAKTVVRLAGNHELMWLQGRFKYSRDSRAVRRDLTQRIGEAILAGQVVGAASLLGGQLLATHAGVRPGMHELLLGGGEAEATGDALLPPARRLARKIHAALLAAVQDCGAQGCPALEGPIFDSGPERRGRGIGGPFWTDFKVLAPLAAGDAPALAAFTQVVGHSAADCDVAPPPPENDDGDGGTVPVQAPKRAAKWGADRGGAGGAASPCQPIRASALAIDVDGAMLWGNRAFLEVKGEHQAAVGSLTLVSHTKQADGTWFQRDLTQGPTCGLALEG